MSAPVATRAVDEAGFAPDDARTRVALLGVADRAFRRAYGVPPEWGWFVPGRIEIFGKHTDYPGGASLVAAVPRGFVVVATPRADGRLSVVDARSQERVVVTPDDNPGPPRGWANYVHVVARRLALNFPGADLGADIVMASDLPRAAGLSSSSALVVAMALVLIRRGLLTERPEWRAVLESTFDVAGYLGAIEAGRGFRTLEAASGVGTAGGSEDHTAILASAPGRVRAFSYVPVEPIGEAAMPQSWSFVIMTSGVHADKAGRVMGQYNRASQSARAIVDVCSEQVDPPVTLAALVGRPGAESRLRAAIAEARHPDFAADELQARLSHFIAENERVRHALEAFRHGARDRLGELSAASQVDAERLLGNQVPETIALARAAREAGAFAASSFGAGFGGSVWALVDNVDLTEFADRWRARYRALQPGVRNVEWFAARPGPAAFGFDLSSSRTSVSPTAG